MNIQKYRIFFLFLLLSFLLSCSDSEVEKKPIDIEKVRTNDNEKVISHDNLYYGFVYSLPKEWEVEFADTKSGGYSVTNKELNFSFSTHGFAPFKIKSLKFSAEIMWEELNPEGIRFTEKGKIEKKGYESYYVAGSIDDEENYLFVMTLYDQQLKKNFVLLLQIINQPEKIEQAREILQSIRKV